jgi:hypothetical protein
MEENWFKSGELGFVFLVWQAKLWKLDEIVVMWTRGRVVCQSRGRVVTAWRMMCVCRRVLGNHVWLIIEEIWKVPRLWLLRRRRHLRTKRFGGESRCMV